MAQPHEEWVLWAFCSWQPTPIKLTGGPKSQCQAEQRTRTAQSWTCGLYRAGTSPAGLRDQALQVGTRAMLDDLAAGRKPSHNAADQARGWLAIVESVVDRQLAVRANGELLLTDTGRQLLRERP